MKIPSSKELDRYFPVSAYIRPTLIQSLLIVLAIYIVSAALIHFVLGIFHPILIIRIIRWIVDVYITLGIIYSILKYLQIIKR